MSHNKKRNTAFLFEVLLQEQTKCILKKQDKKAKFIENLLKKYFNKESVLYKELELYHVLSETNVQTKEDLNELISSVKQERRLMSDDKIFEQQSKLISIINKSLGVHVYENFVPNYKILATINFIFNKTSSFSEKMMMESSIKDYVLKKNEQQNEYIKQDVNMLVFKKCLENFNTQYSDLLDEQKKLLNQFLLYKFGEKIDFKLYLNEECNRLVTNIEKNKEKIKDNEEIYEKVNKAIKSLKTSSSNYFDDIFVYSILNYQKLSRELENES